MTIKDLLEIAKGSDEDLVSDGKEIGTAVILARVVSIGETKNSETYVLDDGTGKVIVRRNLMYSQSDLSVE